MHFKTRNPVKVKSRADPF